MFVLTGGVVVERERLVLAAVVVSKQRLVVAVLVPVEGLDLEAASLGVTADDPGDGLVHGAGRRRRVVREEDDLIPQVDPALHTGQLGETEMKGQGLSRRDLLTNIYISSALNWTRSLFAGVLRYGWLVARRL